MSKQPPLILITGCGSSGTGFITKVFKRAGLKVGHEFVREHGMSSWYAAAGKLDPRDKDWYRRLRKQWSEDIRLDHFPTPPIIVHQTRYPLHTIATFQRSAEWSWKFIYHVLQQRGVEITPEMSLIKRCMLYWYHWNLMAEEMAEWQYRIEDLSNCYCNLCVKIQRPRLCDKRDALFSVEPKRRVNSRPYYYKPLSWLDLMDTDPELTKQIQVLAWHYG
jgi:hypothetical protein